MKTHRDVTATGNGDPSGNTNTDLPHPGHTASSGVVAIAWLLGVCSAISVAAALVVGLWPTLYKAQDYPEAIVGFMTWYDGDKNQDLNAIYLFGGLCFALLFVFQLGLKWAIARLPESIIRELIWLGWVISAPVMCWFFGALLREHEPSTPWMFLALWFGGWIWIATLGARSTTERSSDLVRLGVSGMAAVVLVFLGSLGALMPIGRLGWIDGNMGQWLPWVAATVAWAGLLISAWRGVSMAKLQEMALKLGAIWGLFLPLYWFALVPPLVHESGPGNAGSLNAGLLNHDRTVQIWALTTTLWIVCTAGSVWWMLKENRVAMSDGDRFWHRFFQPLSLASLASFIGASGYMVAQLPPDHWHDGEAMLPWHQLWNFGSIPFVDFNCALGLNSILRGAFNQVLWNGWTGTFVHSSVVIFALGGAALALAAWYCAGPIPALVVALLCAPTLDRFQLVVPTLIILISPRLIERRTMWLVYWMIGSLATTLFNPSTGIALALASTPVALWMMWRAWVEEPRKFRAWGLATALVLTLLVVFTPLGKTMLGLYEFVKENQHGYVQQAGLPLGDTWWRMNQSSNTVSVSGFYDLLIFGWIPFGAVMGALWTWELMKPPAMRKYALMAACWIAAIWVGILSKWTSIRLEFGGLARGGLTSYICIVFIGALIALASQRTRQSKLVGIMLIFAAACLYHISMLTDGTNLADAAFIRRDIPADHELLTPEQSDLTAGGYCVGRTQEIKWLENLIDLRRKFPANAGLFAFTSRNMMYIYLHEKVPSKYSGTYYLATDQMQRKVISELISSQTRLVILSPTFTSGEGPISLRSMRMGRWVMTHFRPVGTLANCLGMWTDPLVPGPERWKVAELFEKMWVGNDYSYVEGNLRSIPAAWGGSLSSITSTLDPHTNLDNHAIAGSPNPLENAFPHAEGPAFYFDLSRLQRPADEADYLSAQLLFPDRELRDFVTLRLEWLGSDGHVAPGVTWTVPASRLKPAPDVGPNAMMAPVLVPLAFRPLWVLGPEPVALRISVINSARITNIGIRNAAFWSLKP